MVPNAAETQIARRYQLLNELGSGGMGVVYRALDRLSGQVVALKQVTIESNRLQFSTRVDKTFDSEDVRLALAQEFRTLASLRHPNIVSVIDYGFDGQRQPFFTMNLLENAQAFCQAGRGQPAEVQYGLLIQLFQALLYLHRRGILHRDLKPSNVVVVSGQVKLLDFGLSVAQDDDSNISGTLAYMAPELFSGQRASEASDLYAVGVIAYELLADRHPFLTEKLSDLIQNILTDEPDMAALHQSEPVVAVIERLLAKHPEDRYGDAASALADFSAATGQHLPTETALTRESFLQAARLVGREAELAQLSQALEKAIQCQGSLWLVGGESGIGKSRLLDELRILALVGGVLVLRGQAVSEGGIPYLLWRDALRQLCLCTPLSGHDRSVLKALVPDIGVLLDCGVPDAPQLDPEAAQERLITVVGKVLALQNQPLLVLLEDAQWAGSESLLLLQRLQQQIGQQMLMIVASYRSDERLDLPDELPGAQVVMLKRLPPGQIADLSASILGERTGRTDSLTHLLTRETEGNVFFIVEVLRALAEESGQLDRIGLTTLPAHVFSGGMKMIVQRRLRRVPTSAQPLLQAAAAIGRQIDPVLLRAIEPQTDLEDWLAVCADSHVLDSQENHWRFSHDKLREGLLADLPTDFRQAVHEQVALAIEQCYPDDPAQFAALAGHWDTAGDAAKAVHYAELAGSQALRGNAYQEAVSFLERALHSQSELEQDGIEHARLHRLLGEAYNDLGNFIASATHMEQAMVDLGVRLPRTHLGLALRALGQICLQLAYQVLSPRLWRRVPEARRAVYQEIGSLYRHLSLAYYFNDEMWPFLYIINRGLNAAELANMTASRAEGYGYMFCGYSGFVFAWYLNRPTPAALVPFMQRIADYYGNLAFKLLEPLGFSDSLAWVCQTVGYGYVARGAWSQADEMFQRGEAVAGRAESLRRRVEILTMAAFSCLLQGQFERVFETGKRSVAVTAHGDTQGRLAGLTNQVIALLRQGAVAEAAPFAPIMAPLLNEPIGKATVVWGHGVLALLALRSGDPVAAEQHAASALQTMREGQSVSYWTFEGWASTVETSLALWQNADDAEDRQAHRQYAVEGLFYAKCMATQFPVLHARYQLYQGLFDEMDGNRPRAMEHWHRALADAQKMGEPYEEARARYELGRNLPARNPQRAEHLTRAAEIFEEIGAIPDLQLARQALRASGTG